MRARLDAADRVSRRECNRLHRCDAQEGGLCEQVDRFMVFADLRVPCSEGHRLTVELELADVGRSWRAEMSVESRDRKQSSGNTAKCSVSDPLRTSSRALDRARN